MVGSGQSSQSAGNSTAKHPVLYSSTQVYQVLPSSTPTGYRPWRLPWQRCELLPVCCKMRFFCSNSEMNWRPSASYCHSLCTITIILDSIPQQTLASQEPFYFHNLCTRVLLPSSSCTELHPCRPPGPPEPADKMKGEEYPTGLPPVIAPGDEELMAELTMDELKTAFRLFDEDGEGFIRVLTFRVGAIKIV